MALEKFTFSLPVKLDFGVGVSGKVGTELKELGCSKALVVTDKGIVKAGILDKIKESLDSAGVKSAVFSGVKPNPTIENIEEGSKVYRSENCDCIVGLGGGSSMDCSKGIGVLVTNPGYIKDYEIGKKKIENPIPPTITIPTTAGTASEVNAAGVITDSKIDTKWVFFDDMASPRLALADPELTMTLPPKLTAGQGLDVLAHAIEAYLSKLSNSPSDALALYAIDLVSNNLRQAFSKGEDLEARSNMLLASIFSGIAECNSKVGNGHALAHALGGYYDLPHGLLCGIFLPHFMEFNMPTAPKKLVVIAETMGENVDNLSIMEGADRAVHAVRRFMSDLEIPTLKELGVKEKDIPKLAEMALADMNAPGNARITTVEDMARMIRKAL